MATIQCRPLQVNIRWILKFPLFLDEILRELPTLFDNSGISWEVGEGPPGGLGIPRWRVIIFSAQHGDFDRLQADVASAMSDAGLTEKAEELTRNSTVRY